MHQGSITLSLLSLSLAIAGCGSPVLEDLENFCKVASEVKGKQGLDTEARLESIAARKAEYAKVTEEPFAELWANFGSAPVEKRYALLVAAAKEAGKSDWRCASYERLVELHEVERAAAQKLAEEKAAKEASKLALAAAGPEKRDGSPVKEKKKGKKRRARRQR